MSGTVPLLFAINDRLDEDTSGSEQDRDEDEDEEAQIVLNELERLHTLHSAIKLALNGRFFSSDVQPLDVLENALGPGIWATDIATHYPNTNVSLLAMDHSTLLPLPRNGTLTEPPLLPSVFDLIYARGLIASKQATTEHISSLFSSLRDRGCLELLEIKSILHEHDQKATNQSTTSSWFQKLNSLEGEIDIESVLKSAADKTNLQVDINSNFIQMPVGEWHDDPTQKQIGCLVKSAFLSFFNTVSVPLALKHFGWDQSDIALNQYKVRSELDITPPRKFYLNMHIIIATLSTGSA